MSQVVYLPPRLDAPSRPRRYLDLAEAYAQVARALLAAGDSKAPAEPLYMLLAHGMELALKAIVARGRCNNEGLILLGHDLPLCLRAAKRAGLELLCESAVEPMIEALAMPHLAQALRYPAYLSWPLPDPHVAVGALEDLLKRVRLLIGADAGTQASC
jgi:hypothetical protein